MKIHRDHCLGKREAKNRVSNIADSLGDKYGLASSWNGDCLMIDGAGVTGQLVVSEEAVDVEIKLGFALAMMQNTIRTSVEEAMEKHLG